ncbi:Hypp3797 [Branchiostoma lanceolatum]|uniref:Hypp3797 protein n=1 Tax=Branchiostoma lanceolatum TaxID=7740 RepID=A0A8K0EZ38_BRALA|nr:Hypp3797 [Branchiostoma lanceolatum]
MERFSLTFLLVANLAWAADLTNLDHLCSDGTLPEKIVVKDRNRGEWQPKSGQPVFCSEHYPHYSCCPHDYQADFQHVNYEVTSSSGALSRSRKPPEGFAAHGNEMSQTALCGGAPLFVLAAVQ